LWRTAFVDQGVLEVSAHKTVLLSDSAEWPEEIDYERALTAKQKAEETLQAAMFKFETDKTQATLKRAEYRIKAYGLK
ncbi:MAG: F0F1 ATP synthase subunit epsilon, partial [Treponema sp.]|nr:F0F1 ATP synthase subunit epsilon [Treponema sp.]